MKVLKILSHPILLAISFSFILVVGEKLSWFYIVAVMLGIVQGMLHSIFGVTGLLAILILPSFKLPGATKHILSIVGALLLAISLLVFFTSDKGNRNSSSFSEPASLTTLILFCTLWIIFVLQNLRSLASELVHRNRDTLSSY
jgi:hypothetical protein